MCRQRGHEMCVHMCQHASMSPVVAIIYAGKEVTELQRNNLHLNSELQRFQLELQHAESHQGEAARKLGETEAKAEKLGQQLAETHMQLGEGSRQLWEAEEALQAAQGKLQEQSAEQQSLVQRHEGTQVLVKLEVFSHVVHTSRQNASKQCSNKQEI